MAIGELKASAMLLESVKPVATGSVQIGPWVTIHDNAEDTPSTAPELIRPLSVTSANVHALKVPPGASRVMLRVRWTAAGAVTTSPVIRAYSVYGSANASGWFADDGTVQLARIDRNATGAGGVTVTLDATNDLRDATYSYSAPAIHSDDGTPWMDCKGGGHVFVLVATAANVAGAQPCVIQAAFLN